MIANLACYRDDSVENNKQQTNNPIDSTSSENIDGNEACADAQTSEQEDENNANSIGFLSVIGSVLAAIFGIQSEKNRQRDFQQSSPVAFISVGIIVVMTLVITMIAIVDAIISSTG